MEACETYSTNPKNSKRAYDSMHAHKLVVPLNFFFCFVFFFTANRGVCFLALHSWRRLLNSFEARSHAKLTKQTKKNKNETRKKKAFRDSERAARCESSRGFDSSKRHDDKVVRLRKRNGRELIFPAIRWIQLAQRSADMPSCSR